MWFHQVTTALGLLVIIRNVRTQDLTVIYPVSEEKSESNLPPVDLEAIESRYKVNAKPEPYKPNKPAPPLDNIHVDYHGTATPIPHAFFPTTPSFSKSPTRESVTNKPLKYEPTESSKEITITTVKEATDKAKEVGVKAKKKKKPKVWSEKGKRRRIVKKKRYQKSRSLIPVYHGLRTTFAPKPRPNKATPLPPKRYTTQNASAVTTEPTKKPAKTKGTTPKTTRLSPTRTYSPVQLPLFEKDKFASIDEFSSSFKSVRAVPYFPSTAPPAKEYKGPTENKATSFAPKPSKNYAYASYIQTPKPIRSKPAYSPRPAFSPRPRPKPQSPSTTPKVQTTPDDDHEPSYGERTPNYSSISQTYTTPASSRYRHANHNNQQGGAKPLSIITTSAPNHSAGQSLIPSEKPLGRVEPTVTPENYYSTPKPSYHSTTQASHSLNPQTSYFSTTQPPYGSDSPSQTPSYHSTPSPSFSPSSHPAYHTTHSPSFSPSPRPSYRSTPSPSYSSHPKPAYHSTPNPSYSPSFKPVHHTTHLSPRPTYSPQPEVTYGGPPGSSPYHSPSSPTRLYPTTPAPTSAYGSVTPGYGSPSPTTKPFIQTTTTSYGYNSEPSQDEYESDYNEQDDEIGYEKRPYSFHYGVKDERSGNDFSRVEDSSGRVTTGSYKVALPDGRVQIVNYVADASGYKATVTYEGVPVFPDPSYYKQQPPASAPYSPDAYEQNHVDNNAVFDFSPSVVQSYYVPSESETTLSRRTSSFASSTTPLFSSTTLAPSAGLRPRPRPIRRRNIRHQSSYQRRKSQNEITTQTSREQDRNPKARGFLPKYPHFEPSPEHNTPDGTKALTNNDNRELRRDDRDETTARSVASTRRQTTASTQPSTTSHYESFRLNPMTTTYEGPTPPARKIFTSTEKSRPETTTTANQVNLKSNHFLGPYSPNNYPNQSQASPSPSTAYIEPTTYRPSQSTLLSILKKL
ncbi:hypothetical protein TCAL_08450 [Tigriopus californicus]|uniref:Pro-resilin n=1 Tax=Tigriopus californicus TaxID=6832 RepID=A0A553P3B5_TIGCA|nr:adhesive plaque matrix protein-like [Tigriopus californicus]TRY72173.1 hypothetical protein TCAL_08450 [Tigriopus californicus]|eukprot:TCALIF_08450-PA protein Name:"Similar to resilin Pro-resilin (Drosophila melanogaster)" AED:0.19 eAED:0.11 QI:21/1/0.33/1/1/1/3/0/963